MRRKTKLGGEKKMKRRTRLLRLTIVIAVLASIGITVAVIPPPAVDQTLGLYDTVCSEFGESDCRSCHSSGVPDAHHLLVGPGSDSYKCKDCHPPGSGGGVAVTRDCTVCHDTTPHHEADAAWDRHCSECHGSFVDDYDDGHYIPDYEPSLITPDTAYRVINETTGKKWGGCEACHEPDPTMDPKIESNSVTHHTAVYTISCGQDPDNNLCHFDPVADIRKCEDCHGVNSIHNIQYDYDNTTGQLGYGHIGDNWDCMGCHAWYEAYKGDPPIDPVIVPFMSSITPSSLVTGEETVVTIRGSDFVTTVDGTTYTCNVDVDGEIIEPDTITATEITVTLPGLDTGCYGVHLIKAELRSNRLPITVSPEVRIESATVDEDGIVTVIGEGFGYTNFGEISDVLGLQIIKSELKNSLIPGEITVIDWTDAKIQLKYSQKLGSSAVLKVATPFDEDSARITRAGTP